MFMYATLSEVIAFDAASGRIFTCKSIIVNFFCKCNALRYFRSYFDFRCITFKMHQESKMKSAHCNVIEITIFLFCFEPVQIRK